MHKSEPSMVDHHWRPTIKLATAITELSKDDSWVLLSRVCADEKENPSVIRHKRTHQPIRAHSYSSALQNFYVNQANPFHLRSASNPDLLEEECTRYPLEPMAIPSQKSPRKARRYYVRPGRITALRREANKDFFHKTVHAELMRVAKGRFEDHQATIIQAAFRGFLARRYQTCFSPMEKRETSHRRNMSEITMSAFGDSIASLGSFTLSPQPFDDVDDFGFLLYERSHTSFSTIFSNDSSDLPAKPPSRKLSPRKDALQRSSKPSGESTDVLQRMDGLRLGDDDDGDASLCFPSLEPRHDKQVYSERGHLSFPSFFKRDKPAKCPRRSHSPIPNGSGRESATSGRTRASSLDCSKR